MFILKFGEVHIENISCLVFAPTATLQKIIENRNNRK